MKKIPFVLSLMILSSFVFVNTVNAEGASSKNTGVKAVEFQKIEEAKKMNNERILEEAKIAKEIKQREIEKVAEEVKIKKEELKNQMEDTREVKNGLVEKKIERKEGIKDIKENDLKDVGELRKTREASGSSTEHMSQVADDVNKLLQMKEDTKGIGKKVKEVAEEQIKSQEKIAEKLAKMEEKKVWLKKMLGYDKEAVLSVQEEIDANRLRILELQKLQEETTDKTEITSLENAANSLIEQNASLQDTVQTEMQNQGVWGWFRGFFKNN